MQRRQSNPVRDAVVFGWRRHFLGSSLRVAASSFAPSFRMRRKLDEVGSLEEEPPAKRQKKQENQVTEKIPQNVQPEEVPSESESSDEEDVIEEFVPAEVAIPESDNDSKTLIQLHFPSPKWRIACSVEGCACTHCGPARASVCSECEHEISQHTLTLPLTAKQSITIVVNRFYDLVHGARAAAFVFQYYHWIAPLIATIKSDLASMQHNVAGRNVSPQLKGLLFAFQELLKKSADLPTFETASNNPVDLEKYRVEMVILLDGLYWELYHFSSVAKIGLEKKVSILPPEEYFELFAAKHHYIQKRKLYQFIHQEIGSKLRKQIEAACEGDLMEEQSTPKEYEPSVLKVWRIKWRETVELFYGTQFIEPEMSQLLQKTVMIAAKIKHKNLKKEKTAAELAGNNESLEEPICFDLLQRWRDACRDWASVIYAYAVPNMRALNKLKELSPIVEMGAGTGYWMHLLKTMDPSVDFICYDTIPPRPELTDNEFHGNRIPFVDVLEGEPFKLLSDPRCEKRTLFLCYPPPKDEMAIQCLQYFTGDTIVHVGEWEGFTATREFEARLCGEYKMMERIELPNWADTAYFMTIWKRRSKLPEAERQHNPVHVCSACRVPGNPTAPLMRCRFCRAVQYCSKACVQAHWDKHKQVHHSKMIRFEGWLNWFNPLHFSVLQPL